MVEFVFLNGRLGCRESELRHNLVQRPGHVFNQGVMREEGLYCKERRTHFYLTMRSRTFWRGLIIDLHYEGYL
jgi:hypothetical protein